MINLIFKNGKFSFEGQTPSRLDSPTVDVTIKVLDEVPQKCQARIEGLACDFINEKYGTEYKSFPGDFSSTESKEVSLIKEFNFRLSD